MDIFNKTIDWDISNASGGLSPRSRDHLKMAGGWAIFLAIIGFLTAGFIATMGSLVKEMFSELLGPGGMVITLIYLSVAAIYFIPSIFLLNFGNNAREAAKTEDADLLEKALDNLRKFLFSLGILTILAIVMNVGFYITVIGVAATAN